MDLKSKVEGQSVGSRSKQCMLTAHNALSRFGCSSALCWLTDPGPWPSCSITTWSSTSFGRSILWGNDYSSKMAATRAALDSQKETLLRMIMNVVVWPQKFGDNPNSLAKMEADFFSLFYNYKDLVVDSWTSSTKQFPGTHDVAGVLLGVWKYVFQ